MPDPAASARAATATVCPARPEEARVLTEIAWASKRHWGYPDEWMEKWRAALQITPEYVKGNPVFTATLDDETVAFCAIVRTASGWDLDHLWVRPGFFGRGIGAALFRHAVEHIRASGGPATLTIESEPNAEGFYSTMGARRVSTSVRDWEGLRRELPCLEYSVT